MRHLLSFLAFLTLLSGCRPQPSVPPTRTVESDLVTIESTQPNIPFTSGHETELAESATTVASNVPASPKGEEPSNVQGKPADAIPPGAWTVLRLIVLNSRGPLPIDVMVQIGNQDIESAGQAVIRRIADSILADMPSESTWEKLFDHPLVQSGWLGNLVPPDNQTVQTIEQFDANRDRIVQADELVQFFRRDSLRLDPVRFRDASDQQAADLLASWWGVLDRNSDNLLDIDEIRLASESLKQLDFDNDLNITLAEIATTSPQTSMPQRRAASSVLPVATVIAESPGDSSMDDVRLQRQRRQKASQVLQHYSLDESVDRAQWMTWNDEQWAQLDANQDGRINAREAASLFTVPAHWKVALRIPEWLREESPSPTRAMDFAADLPQWYVQPGSAELDLTWKESGATMRLSTPDCDLLLAFENALSNNIQSIVKRQLEAGLRDEPLKMLISQQLQLSSEAFELIDQDADGRLRDEEFDWVWTWLINRQAVRLTAQWTVPAPPWFQLLDRDLNRRIGEHEMNQAETVLMTLDRDSDGKIGTDEIPLVANLQIRHTDVRLGILELSTLPAAQNELGSPDWFSATDTNSDGVISRAEFLGSRSQFDQLDLDADGFISRAESTASVSQP